MCWGLGELCCGYRCPHECCVGRGLAVLWMYSCAHRYIQGLLVISPLLVCCGDRLVCVVDIDLCVLWR